MLPERLRRVHLPASVTRPPRRVLLDAGLGVTGLGYAVFLAAPKVAAIMAGSLEVVGVGLIANLALAFGSLMLLREAQRRVVRRLPADSDVPRAPEGQATP